MQIVKEEFVWSVKMYFEPVTWTFRVLKKLWKDES